MLRTQKTQPPTRRPRRYAEGATLTVVVLFTMLILSMIMMVTLRLTLSARTGGTDQKAILQSQYSAESNLALARSKLRDIQKVLSGKDSSGADTGYMSLPTTTRSTDIEAWALQFCNQTSSGWKDDPDNTLNGTTTRTQLCTANGTTAQSYNILGNLISSAGYAALPAVDSPPASGASVATKSAWWFNYLNNTNPNNGLTLTVVPEKVVKLGYSYRFYFKPETVMATSPTSSTGFRKLIAHETPNGNWWFQIDIPNPFDNALFINQWSTSSGLIGDIIKGNTFTNEKIRFASPTNTVQFLGNVSSAGCTALSSSTPATGADCSPKTAGFFKNMTTTVSSSGTTPAAINNSLKSAMINLGTTVASGKTVSFNAKYTSLPLDGTTQQAAAAANGIIAPSNATNIYLYAGGNDGNPFDASKYDNSTTSWRESSPTYQYIKYSTSSGTALVGYRIDSNGNMYKNTGTATSPIWTSQNKTFNGVLYSDHLLNVSGPARTTTTGPGDVSKMPPAIASFSTINLTAVGGLNLATDLTTSNTPCGYDNTWYTPSGVVSQPGCPKTPPPINMLSLFAPTGNISIYPSFAKEATYHAAILASQGAFQVTNFNSGSSMGKRHVVGAVVEKYFGDNAHSSSSGAQLSGYRDDFSQDVRLKNTDAIPFNPIVASGSWTYTNSSTDSTSPDYKSLDNLIWKQDKQ